MAFTNWTGFMCNKNSMSLVTDNPFAQNHLNIINGCIKSILDTPDKGLTNYQLEEETIKMVAFSDSSFAKNLYLSTQLGYMIL